MERQQTYLFNRKTTNVSTQLKDNTLFFSMERKGTNLSIEQYGHD